MSITFYLPTYDLKKVEAVETLSARENCAASDIAPIVKNYPSLIWVWSTYLRLRTAGLSCTLSDQFPREGITVSASCNIPLFMTTPANVCHICADADSPPRFYPQIHVLQNKCQCKEYSTTFSIPRFVYIPHWPQPNLVPRDPRRGDTFENLAYVGARDQLAREFQGADATSKFAKAGFDFHIIDDNFNDYSDIDCLVAIRSLDDNPHIHKPASKLVNCWAAGVPAILGPESAYRSSGNSSIDYIEVKTLDECVEALQLLKLNRELRHKMISNGRARWREFSDEAIVQLWLKLLTKDAPEIYQMWRSRGVFFRAAFHLDQFTRRMSRSLAKRLHH